MPLIYNIRFLFLRPGTCCVRGVGTARPPPPCYGSGPTKIVGTWRPCRTVGWSQGSLCRSFGSLSFVHKNLFNHRRRPRTCCRGRDDRKTLLQSFVPSDEMHRFPTRYDIQIICEMIAVNVVVTTVVYSLWSVRVFIS